MKINLWNKNIGLIEIKKPSLNRFFRITVYCTCTAGLVNISKNKVILGSFLKTILVKEGFKGN
jgi:hypothetical protein